MKKEHIFHLSLIFFFIIAIINLSFDFTSLYSYKLLYLSKKQKDIHPDIIVLALDDFTAKNLKTKTVPSRKIFAQAIKNLKELGVKAIVFDVIFKGTSPDDQILSQAMEDAGNVIIASYEWDKSTLSATNFYQNLSIEEKITPGKEEDFAFALIPEPIRKAAAGIGMIHIEENIIIKDLKPYIKINDKVFPRLFLKVIESLEKEKVQIHSNYISVGKYKIPLNYRGNVTLNYEVSELEKLEHWYPFYLVVGPQWKKQTRNLDFKDKIVFIIPASFSYHDVINAPAFADATSPFMFGGMLHINLVNQILKNRYLKEIPPIWTKLLILTFSIITFWIFFHLDFLKSLIVFLVIALFYPVNSAFWFLNFKIIGFNFLLLDLTLLITLFLSFGFKYLKEAQIKNMFRRYVGDSILNEVIKLGDKETIFVGQEKELTIFLMDIRGFTSLSSRLNPQEIVKILNSFFNLTTEIILKYEGTIDKFMGDAVLAFFGAPIEIEKKEEKAIRAAQEILQELDKKMFNGEKLKVGIAITTGSVVVGNIGSSKKVEYTIIGPAVNLASRIEGYNRQYGTSLIMDQATKEKVEDAVEVVFLGKEKIRGIKEEQRLYTLKNYLERSV